MDRDGCERHAALVILIILGGICLPGFIGYWHDRVAWWRHFNGLDIRQCFCELQFLMLE